jgi:hypothetical protein
MTREVAERIANAMKNVDRALDELQGVLVEVDNTDERKVMIETLFRSVHFLHVNISVAVAKHFPDLHPDVPGSTTY